MHARSTMGTVSSSAKLKMKEWCVPVLLAMPWAMTAKPAFL